ncbi:unnamed protein product [Dovyalis caffra]|uniref:Uncharacterized protein n=1 Tax=Dovyalis caffra TaxID=77055 RepID=A0AAV1R1W2_9ROSI|nr:unnamed protein product [Dovyalis caffra]
MNIGQGQPFLAAGCCVGVAGNMQAVDVAHCLGPMVCFVSLAAWKTTRRWTIAAQSKYDLARRAGIDTKRRDDRLIN